VSPLQAFEFEFIVEWNPGANIHRRESSVADQTTAYVDQTFDKSADAVAM